MSDIYNIYKNLTGVDIEKQQKIWDERGKGYWGEFLVFQQLYQNLNGTCKILMNLQIPIKNRTTEIDLLLIHETGIYVFEIKHYKGTIYGKQQDYTWTQYFRTTPNAHFHNPILQNKYHIEALQVLYSNIPLYSFVVFTNPEVDLRLNYDKNQISVCKLRELQNIVSFGDLKEKKLNIDEIDKIFNDLSSFSPMSREYIDIDKTEITITDYTNALFEEYRKDKLSLDQEFQENKQSLNKKYKKLIFSSFVIVFICLLIAFFVCLGYKNEADHLVQRSQQELNIFKQKFEEVETYNNGNIILSENFITVSDIKIYTSKDLQKTTNLSFTLTWNGENYTARITRDSKINVILKDGSVKEYSLNEKTFPNKTSNLDIGKGNARYIAKTKYEFPIQELFNVDLNEIAHIKLTNIFIWVSGSGSNKPLFVGTGFEIQIF